MCIMATLHKTSVDIIRTIVVAVFLIRLGYGQPGGEITIIRTTTYSFDLSFPDNGSWNFYLVDAFDTTRGMIAPGYPINVTTSPATLEHLFSNTSYNVSVTPSSLNGVLGVVLYTVGLTDEPFISLSVINETLVQADYAFPSDLLPDVYYVVIGLLHGSGFDGTYILGSDSNSYVFPNLISADTPGGFLFATVALNATRTDLLNEILYRIPPNPPANASILQLPFNSYLNIVPPARGSFDGFLVRLNGAFMTSLNADVTSLEISGYMSNDAYSVASFIGIGSDEAGSTIIIPSVIGVVFIDGDFTTSSNFVELKSGHEVTFSAMSFLSDSTQGGVNGNNLWRLRVYASTVNDTGYPGITTAISEAYAVIGDNSRDMDLYPGDTLSINGSSLNSEVYATLNLSNALCSELVYLCAVAERDPTSMPIFEVTSYTVCKLIECVGWTIENITVRQAFEPFGNFPVRELVSFTPADGQLLRLAITLLTNIDSASPTGIELSNAVRISAFLSGTADCATVVDEITTSVTNQSFGEIIVAGVSTTLPDLEVYVNTTSLTCNAAPYICVNFNLNDIYAMIFAPILGVTTGSLMYDCVGIQLNVTSVDLTTPSSKEIIERMVTTFTLNILLGAHSNAGNAIGDTLWEAFVYLSPDSDGFTILSAAETADSGVWQDTDVEAGTFTVIAGISSTIHLTESCDQMKYLCVDLRKNNASSQDFTFDLDFNDPIACTDIAVCHGVIIDSVDFEIQSERVIYEADDAQTLTISVFLNVNSQSAEFEDNEIQNVWALTIFPNSSREFAVPVFLSQEQTNHGVTRNSTVDYINIVADLSLFNFTCPPNKNYVEELCVQASSGMEINPLVTVEILSDIGCIEVDCRGVILADEELSITAEDNFDIMAENLMIQPFMFNFSARVSNISTVISNGVDLWMVLVYGSSSKTGEALRYSETQIPLNGFTNVIPKELVSYDNLFWDLSFQNFTCTDEFYMCVHLMSGTRPIPLFSTRPGSGVRGCTLIDCIGVVVELALDVVDGDIVLERSFNDAVVTVTAISQPWGSSISGQGLWSMNILVCLDDGCNSESIQEVFAPLTAIQTDQNLLAGQNITFANLAVDLDLIFFGACPESETLFLCAQLQKGNKSNPDFKLQSYTDVDTYPTTCKEISCRGVHIANISASNPSGILQEGNPDNPITLYLSFTADFLSAGVSGRDLWEVVVYGSSKLDGTGERIGLDLGNITGQDDASVSSGGTVQFRDMFASVDMSVYKTCEEVMYVCAELRQNDASSILFSVTGLGISCTQYNCTGVLVSKTSVEIFGDNDVVEGKLNGPLVLLVNMTIDPDSSTLTNVTDAWHVEVFGNILDTGLGRGTAIRSIADTSATGNVGAVPGEVSTLVPVSVDFNLTDEFCADVNYLCVEVYRGNIAYPPFSLKTVPLDNFSALVGCAPVNCIGVRISGGNVSVTSGNPVLQGHHGFNVVLDAVFNLDPSGASVSGTDNFGLKVFLVGIGNGTEFIGSSAVAIVPSLYTTHVAGGTLSIHGASASIDTDFLICSFDSLHICAELFKPENASSEYRLTGYDARKGVEDVMFLTECVEVECRDVAFDDLFLVFSSQSPYSILERTTDQLLEVNLYIFPNATWGSVSGTNLWQITFTVRSETGDELVTGEVAFPKYYQDYGISAGRETVFFDLQLALNFTYQCPSEIVTLCTRISPQTNANFSLSESSLTDVCLADVPCVGVLINDMIITFLDGVPLLETSIEHNVNFSLRLSSGAQGADASGTNLWNLTAFMSRDQTGNHPISETIADIGEDTNMMLQAGGAIVLNAYVTLSADNVLCGAQQLFLCVKLEKGAAVSPEFTLEGVGTYEGNLTICEHFACQGVLLTFPVITFGHDIYLLEFSFESEVVVDINIDVRSGSASIFGTNLWQFTFFTSDDYGGYSQTSLSTTVDQLPFEQGNVSLVAGETSTISGVNAILNLRNVSCLNARRLCVEVWKGSMASPSYTIDSPAFQENIRACQYIDCVGVQLLEVTPVVIAPSIWIENKFNPGVTMEIILQPNSSGAGILGDDLFEVNVFATSSPDGKGRIVSEVTVSVPNAYASNRELDRFNGTTLVNVQASLTFSGYTCSQLTYVCVEVLKGRNAFPDFSLSGALPGSFSEVGCSPQRCAGVVVKYVFPIPTSLEILEGDSAHTFTMDVIANSGDSITTNGTEAWNLEVFIGSYLDWSDEYANLYFSSLTARAEPYINITFSDIEATLDLSDLPCANLTYLCVRLSAPSANFTLAGDPSDAVLLGCFSLFLKCAPMNGPLYLDNYTDTTLSVSWPHSIGDFDSYRITIQPDGNTTTLLKSELLLAYTFEGLTPGQTYTITVELMKRGMVKGTPLFAIITLKPACPDVSITTFTSNEITLAWTRPPGYENVYSYEFILSPSNGVTPSSPHILMNPFHVNVSDYSFVFSSIQPASLYSISVVAMGYDFQESEAGCNTVYEVTYPGEVFGLLVSGYTSDTISLAWSSDVSPPGFHLVVISIDDDNEILIPGIDRSYTVADLLPGDSYKFIVGAYVNVSGILRYGRGAKIIQRTKPLRTDVRIDVTETRADVTYSAPSGYFTSFIHVLYDSDGVVVGGPITTTYLNASFSSLSPASQYTHTIYTTAVNETSEATDTSFYTRPNPPQEPIMTADVTTASIVIMWEDNLGERDYYVVSYTPTDPTYNPSSPSLVVTNTFTLTDLDPGIVIEFNVVAVYGGVQSTSIQLLAKTYDICPVNNTCPTKSSCLIKSGITTCTCNKGYEKETALVDEMTVDSCLDINECDLTTYPCDSDAECDNYPGGYFCTCLEGYEGDGFNCTEVDACESNPCSNGGTCTNTPAITVYACICLDKYSGINCNIEEVTNAPPAVVRSPTSRSVDARERVSLYCSFLNVVSFEWYKGSRRIRGKTNTSPLVINSVLAEDQGYYFCRGAGENSVTVNTDTAVLTVNGVDNYVVYAAFALEFTDSLLDQDSQAYANIAQRIHDFLIVPLQNNIIVPVSLAVGPLSQGSVVANSLRVYLYNGTGSDTDKLALIYSTLLDAAEGSGFLIPETLQILSTVTCPETSLLTRYGDTTFAPGPINTEADSVTVCPSHKLRRGEPIAEAYCEGDYVSPCYWVLEEEEGDYCGRNLTADELLAILQEVNVTADNVVDVAEEAAMITMNSDEITSDGIQDVAEILSDISDIESGDVDVAGSVVAIASNIAVVSEVELQRAQEESGATSMVVQQLEDTLSTVDVAAEAPVRIVEPNVAAEARNISTDELANDIQVIMAVAVDGESISDFRVEQTNLTDQDDVSLDALLFIPANTVNQARTVGTSARLVVTTFRLPSLFQGRRLLEFNNNQTEYNRTVASTIISGAIGDSRVENLTEPVRVVFNVTLQDGRNPLCVFWDFDINDWSQEGCQLNNASTFDRVICECNHLTNFGILMDFYNVELSEFDDFILEIITYIGCSMSVWGLVATILTYAFNRKLRSRKPNQILLSLCTALLCLYITFLVMISLDGNREGVTGWPCRVIAALLQYFTLASIFWMAVEGYNMHRLFVRVLNVYLPNFMRKVSLFAWGAPLLIVGITISIVAGLGEHYVEPNSEVCFISMWPQVGGLLVPIGVIMLFNIINFIRVIRRLGRTVKGRASIDGADKRQRLRRFQNAVMIMVLMGTTWTVGYLSIIWPGSAVVQGLFTVLNSLQGYFIFMLYCVRQPLVRKIWRDQFSCCLPKHLRESMSKFSSGTPDDHRYHKHIASSGGNTSSSVPTSSSNGFRPDSIAPSEPERLPREAGVQDELDDAEIW